MKIEQHLPELRRAIRNNKHEFTETGLFIPSMGLHAGFLVESTVNGRDKLITPNILPKAGRRYLLQGSLGEVSPGALYIAPFSADSTPGEDWTAANFASKTTEFTAYEALNRLQWNRTIDGVESKASNTASPADFEISAGQSGVTFFGFAMFTSQGKGSSAGILVSATRHVRPGLQEGDTISVRLTLEYKNAV